MIGRSPTLVALLLALALLLQTHGTEDAQILEEDHRITSVEERQAAVEGLLKSADEARKSGHLIDAARTLNRVGRFQIRMFVAPSATATFKQALDLVGEQPDIKTQVDSLNGLALSYGKVSNCEDAERYAKQARDLSREDAYIPGQAEALLILSECQNNRDHSLALMTAQESLKLWSSIGHKRGMAEAHLAIAHYQMTLHNLAGCTESLNTALSLFRELNDSVQQAEALIYFGYIEYRKADWQKSLSYLTQAQSMIDKAAEPYKMGQITVGLGDAFLESGIPELALPKYHESLEYFRITKNQRAMSILLWSIGRANFFSGKYVEAIDSLEKARNEAQSSADTTLTAFCDDFLGRTYHALNDNAAALKHFQSSYEGYRNAKNNREAARVQARTGLVYQQQGRYQKAKYNYQMAREMFRTLSDRVNESATLYAIGTMELQANNLDQAEEFLKQSIEMTEEMRRVSTSSDLTAAFSERVADRYETYIECLMRKHSVNPKQRYDVRAFELSESARGRSLSDLLRGTQTNLAPGVEPQLAERERFLRQSLRIKEDYRIRLLAKQYDHAELNALNSELARLGAEYHAVNAEITARNPSYQEINRPTSWNLRQIQEQVVIDDQTVLLEFSLGAHRSYVWVVTRNNFGSHELAPERDINIAAQEVYKLASSKPKPDSDRKLKEAIKKLSSMVLVPVANHLNKPRVIVVADGALNYTPFQILHPQLDTDEPLVAGREVNNGPSASILGQLRQETSRRKIPSKSLAAFGNPVFISNYAQETHANANKQIAALKVSEDEPWLHALRDIELDNDTSDPSDLKPLFFTRIELANLRAVAGADSFVATGFDATREKLSELDLQQYAILHIATHGIFHPKRPENSGLFLTMIDREGQSKNGFLSLQDVYALDAPVHLVVLSACRTGLGKDVRGEGLIGLTRGFMYAGASSVVASLWNVDDEATAELMKHFYANMLQKGMPPAAALRAAQNSIRQQPQWSSPYYWAAFTLQGDYRQAIPSPSRQMFPNTTPIILVFVVPVLLGLAWWYFRHRSLGGRTV